MLDHDAFQEIQGFLLLVEQPDLFTYLELERDDKPNKIKSALRKRRSWAQGQQANPKYRVEALWLIKNIKLLQSALTTEKDSYLAQTDELALRRRNGMFRLFIQSVLQDGNLTAEAEPSVYAKAEELEVPESEVPSHIELVLTAIDQGLLAELPMEDVDDTPQNHYQVLSVSPHSSQEDLEAAYRERYRWARNLRDTEESSRIYAELDSAWRVLKDPEKRAEYNASMDFAEEEPAAAAEDTLSPDEAPAQVGFLPPPTAPPPPVVPDSPQAPQPPEPPEVPQAPEIPEPEIVEAVEAHSEVVAEIVPQSELDEDLLSDPLDMHDWPDPEPQPDTQQQATEADTLAGLDAAPIQDPAPTRTLDIGELSDEALPSLKIVSPTTVRIRTGNNPFPVRIEIANVGQGQMSGSIHCAEEWVEISPKHLNPTRKEHAIEVVVDPAKMPGNAARTTVEITTGHGETGTVVIDALQHLISPMMRLVAGLGLVAGIAVAAAFYIFGGDIETTTAPPPRTILAVHVDPPAGEVYIDDVLVGKQGTMSLVDKFPVDKPFQIRVELDGFEPWSKSATVPEGQQIRVDAELVLRDPMTFAPTAEMRRSEIDDAALKAELERHADSFQNCFTRHLQPDSAYNAAVSLRGTVSQRGYVAAVEFRGSNFDSDDVKNCLKRQLRGLSLPVLPGDYATFEHTFRTRVGPRRAGISEEL